jgi:hypothetical protein
MGCESGAVGIIDARMPDLADVWKTALPQVLNNVTGRGVWTALNTAVPITVEDGVFVLGMPPSDTALGPHLRLPATSQLIERFTSKAAGHALRLRVIDGTALEDWELVKRRDAERRRLQEAEMTKMRAELSARTSWDQVYEQLARRFAAINNRSLPQNRARFFEEAVEIIVEARTAQSDQYDDLSERNFARCLERVAQYTELPSVLVAREVLKRSSEL